MATARFRGEIQPVIYSLQKLHTTYQKRNKGHLRASQGANTGAIVLIMKERFHSENDRNIGV